MHHNGNLRKTKEISQDVPQAIMVLTCQYIFIPVRNIIQKYLDTLWTDYFSLRSDLPLVRHQHFLYGSGTLVLSTRVLHKHFSVMKFLHRRDILFSQVHFHSDIRHNITKLSSIFHFYQFRCTCCFFAQLI